jgi:hypothetical protein
MKMIEDLGWSYANETSKYKRNMAIFECPFCGKHFKCDKNAIRKEHTKSCGCATKELCSRTSYRHGLNETRIYHLYFHIKTRCFNKKHSKYHRYGGRGITMCDEWKNDFMAFYNWSMANGYNDKLEIDRIDNGGNYCPENCRWVSHSQNNQNKDKKANNTSGYTGVSKQWSKWVAKINCDRVHYKLGVYNTKEEAALAYNAFVIKNNTMHRLNIVNNCEDQAVLLDSLISVSPTILSTEGVL